MTDTTRTVLIALGISLMASVIVPSLVCASAMMGMGDMTGMMPDAIGGMGGRGMYWGVASALAMHSRAICDAHYEERKLWFRRQGWRGQGLWGGALEGRANHTVS